MSSTPETIPTPTKAKALREWILLASTIISLLAGLGLHLVFSNSSAPLENSEASDANVGSDQREHRDPDAIGQIDGRENPNVDRASQDATADRKPRTKGKKVRDAVNNIAEAFIDEAPGGKRPSTIKRLGTLGTYLLIAQLVYGSVEIHHLANYVREISSSQQNLVIEEKVFSDLEDAES